MALEVCFINLKELQQVSVSDVRALFAVEHHQNAHLVCADTYFVPFSSIVANSCSYLSKSLIELPLELPTTELAHVVLFENTHALLYFWRQTQKIGFVLLLLLLRWASTFIWPMTCCQNLNLEIKSNHLSTRRFFELDVSLFRHFDVFEHHFQPLCKLEATLFFQLLDHLLLCIFKNSPLIKESFSKSVLVKTFKNIFVLKISENLNDLVNLVTYFKFSIVFEILFEVFIKMSYKTSGCAIIFIHKQFKSPFDGDI